MANIDALNAMPLLEARAALLRCCGSIRWVELMLSHRPFTSSEQLYQFAEAEWNTLDRSDWLEAFAAHPRIGDVESLRKKFAGTADLCGAEQASVKDADEATIQALVAGNRQYEERFWHIFIVCATGKSAQEMLALLRSRLSNDPDTELRIAAAEQAKITRLRLEKL
jgi:2-oxo-4-hydroxy-4-carboxy-5-ureidoimidazoline decarboxylase